MPRVRRVRLLGGQIGRGPPLLRPPCTCTVPRRGPPSVWHPTCLTHPPIPRPGPVSLTHTHTHTHNTHTEQLNLSINHQLGNTAPHLLTPQTSQTRAQCNRLGLQWWAVQMCGGASQLSSPRAPHLHLRLSVGSNVSVFITPWLVTKTFFFP